MRNHDSRSPVMASVFGLALLSIPLIPSASSLSADDTSVKAVTLTIDYGDGVQKRFKAIPWNRGMTVLDALQAAAKHPRGVQIKVRGRGSTAFVTQIDDLKNQGARGLNWIFEVDKKLGHQSCGIQKLNAKNTVLWKFDKYQ